MPMLFCSNIESNADELTATVMDDDDAGRGSNDLNHNHGVKIVLIYIEKVGQ